MNIYRISQEENSGYDTFDSAIVCAESEKEAKRIIPSDKYADEAKFEDWDKYSSWCSSPEQVKVEYLGIAHNRMERGVILASFNAG